MAAVARPASRSSSARVGTGASKGLNPTVVPCREGGNDVNIDMWAQAYWTDSKDGQIRLSRATNVKIPWVPRPVKRAALFQPFGFRKYSTGYGPYTDEDYNPVIRYAN